MPKLTLTMEGDSDEIRNRLQELDCDPLQYATLFLQGKETPGNHPWFQGFLSMIAQLRVFADNQAMNDFINRFEEEGNFFLGPGTYVDIRYRCRIALELLNYIYPKKQSIEHKGDENLDNKSTDVLTDAELRKILSKVIKS